MSSSRLLAPTPFSLLIPCVTAVIVLGAAADSHAQRRSAPPPRTAPQPASSVACDRLTAWTAQLDREYPGENWASVRFPAAQRRAELLFGDENFVPYFQKPYDQFTREERQAALLTQPGMRSVSCPALSAGISRYREVADFVRLGFSGVNENFLRRVAAIRQARPALAQAIRRIGDIRGDVGADYDRLAAIETEMASHLDHLWESERRTFRASLDGARGTLATTGLPARINAAIAARDYEGLVALRTLRQELVALAVGVDAPTRQRYEKQLDDRAASLLRELLAAERTTLAAHAAGPSGLVQDAEWKVRFDEGFAKPFASAPEVAALSKQFDSRRPARLAAAVPELNRLIAQAASHEAVDDVFNRHLVYWTDLDHPGVRPFLGAMWDRKDALRRAAGITIKPPPAAAVAPLVPPPGARGAPPQPFAPTASPWRPVDKQWIRPSIGALVRAQLANAGREMLNARRAKFAIASAIAASRREFWRCNPQCSDEVLSRYAVAHWEKEMYYLFLDLALEPTPSANIFAPDRPGLTPEMVDALTGGKIDGGIPQRCTNEFGVWAAYVGRSAGGTRVNGAYFPNPVLLLSALQTPSESYDAHSACRDAFEWDSRPVSLLFESADPHNHALALFHEYLNEGYRPSADTMRDAERLLERAKERFEEERVLKTASLIMQAPKRTVVSEAVLADAASLGCTTPARSSCFGQLLGHETGSVSPPPTRRTDMSPPGAGAKIGSATPGSTNRDAAGGGSVRPPTASLGSAVRRPAVPVPARLQGLLGKYQTRQGVATVMWDSDRLALVDPQGVLCELEPAGADGSLEFRIKDSTDTVTFRRAGSIVRIDFTRGDAQNTGFRQP